MWTGSAPVWESAGERAAEYCGGDGVPEGRITIPNEIAQNLKAAEDGLSARYDASARNLVAEKPVLAYILKSALDEYEGYTIQEIAGKFIEGVPQIRTAAVHRDHPERQAPVSPVFPMSSGPGEKAEGEDAADGMMSGDEKIEGLSAEDKSQREGTVYYDIRFLAVIPQSGGLVEIFVNIEIQNNDKPGYPIPMRGIYHGAKMISSQRSTVFKDQEYGKIKRVVSIWVCEDTADYRSDTINQYRMTETCKRGDFREEKESYDLMRVVILRLGRHGEKSSDNAIRLLSKMFSVERTYEEKLMALTDEFQISVTKEISREVLNMCNLSTGVYNKGIAVGLREGRQEGWQEGLQEGRMEQARETAYELYDEDGFSPEKIAKRLKVRVDTVEKWLKERLAAV